MTRIFTDQLSRNVAISYPPKKIISLVPSQTELLFHLGIGHRVIGITKFCIHPKDKHQGITKIGGTKNLNISLIKSLQPDLIIGNKEENEKSQIEALAQLFPVWMSDILTLEDAYLMIGQVGNLVDRKIPATHLLDRLKTKFQILNADHTNQQRKRVAYLIWNNPVMVAANHTFINDMIKRAGFENVYEHLDRYPVVDISNLSALQADAILLSSEPFPFKDKHIAFFRDKCPDSKVLLVDGELFSWYGNRLLTSPDYFKQLNEVLH